MADAPFYAAVYVLMIEDYTTNEDNQELKVYAPVSFGSRIFYPNQLKLSIYARNSWQFFCKKDGSHGYFSVPMADEQSVQLLTFNFGSRTFTFQRLAQGLSRSVSTFSSFMRQILDPVITADKCFQYVNDLDIGARDTNEKLEKFRAVFTFIRESGMKLAPDKCAFGLREIEFLGNTITSEGLTPITQKITTFLQTFRMPRNPKKVKRMIGFFQFYKAFIPELAEKLLPFHRLLKKDTIFVIEEEHQVMLEKLTNDLRTACYFSHKLLKIDHNM